MFKQFSSKILPLCLTASMCMLTATCSSMAPRPVSTSVDPEQEALLAMAQRIEDALAQQARQDKAELKSRQDLEKNAQERYVNRAQARREAESELSVRKATENAARAHGRQGEVAVAVRGTEQALARLEAAREREADAKSTYEENIRSRETFEKTAEEREALRRQELEKMAAANAEFQRNPTPEAAANATKTSMAVANSAGIVSQVSWKTLPSEGAYIYYRPHFGDPQSERSINNPSNCIGSLTIGSYYVWSQRNGHNTSVPRLVNIVRPREEVTILEDYSKGGRNGNN